MFNFGGRRKSASKTSSPQSEDGLSATSSTGSGSTLPSKGEKEKEKEKKSGGKGFFRRLSIGSKKGKNDSDFKSTSSPSSPKSASSLNNAQPTSTTTSKTTTTVPKPPNPETESSSDSGSDSDTASDSESSYSSSSSSSSDDDPLIPWREGYDPNYKRTYFFNTVTKESLWVEPVGVEIRWMKKDVVDGDGGGKEKGVKSTTPKKRKKERKSDVDSSGDPKSKATPVKKSSSRRGSTSSASSSKHKRASTPSKTNEQNFDDIDLSDASISLINSPNPNTHTSHSHSKQSQSKTSNSSSKKHQPTSPNMNSDSFNFDLNISPKALSFPSNPNNNNNNNNVNALPLSPSSNSQLDYSINSVKDSDDNDGSGSGSDTEDDEDEEEERRALMWENAMSKSTLQHAEETTPSSPSVLQETNNNNNNNTITSTTTSVYRTYKSQKATIDQNRQKVIESKRLKHTQKTPKFGGGTYGPSRPPTLNLDGTIRDGKVVSKRDKDRGTVGSIGVYLDDRSFGDRVHDDLLSRAKFLAGEERKGVEKVKRESRGVGVSRVSRGLLVGSGLIQVDGNEHAHRTHKNGDETEEDSHIHGHAHGHSEKKEHNKWIQSLHMSRINHMTKNLAQSQSLPHHHQKGKRGKSKEKRIGSHDPTIHTNKQSRDDGAARDVDESGLRSPRGSMSDSVLNSRRFEGGGSPRKGGGSPFRRGGGMTPRGSGEGFGFNSASGEDDDDDDDDDGDGGLGGGSKYVLMSPKQRRDSTSTTPRSTRNSLTEEGVKREMRLSQSSNSNSVATLELDEEDEEETQFIQTYHKKLLAIQNRDNEDEENDENEEELGIGVELGLVNTNANKNGVLNPERSISPILNLSRVNPTNSKTSKKSGGRSVSVRKSSTSHHLIANILKHVRKEYFDILNVIDSSQANSTHLITTKRQLSELLCRMMLLNNCDGSDGDGDGDSVWVDRVYAFYSTNDKMSLENCQRLLLQVLAGLEVSHSLPSSSTSTSTLLDLDVDVDGGGGGSSSMKSLQEERQLSSSLSAIYNERRLTRRPAHHLNRSDAHGLLYDRKIVPVVKKSPQHDGVVGDVGDISATQHADEDDAKDDSRKQSKVKVKVSSEANSKGRSHKDMNKQMYDHYNCTFQPKINAISRRMDAKAYPKVKKGTATNMNVNANLTTNETQAQAQAKDAKSNTTTANPDLTQSPNPHDSEIPTTLKQRLDKWDRFAKHRTATISQQQLESSANEMLDCTFKPTLNPGTLEYAISEKREGKVSSDRIAKRLYNDSKAWIETSKNNRLRRNGATKDYTEEEIELKLCTFKPDIKRAVIDVNGVYESVREVNGAKQYFEHSKKSHTVINEEKERQNTMTLRLTGRHLFKVYDPRMKFTEPFDFDAREVDKSNNGAVPEREKTRIKMEDVTLEQNETEARKRLKYRAIAVKTARKTKVEDFLHHQLLKHHGPPLLIVNVKNLQGKGDRLHVWSGDDLEVLGGEYAEASGLSVKGTLQLVNLLKDEVARVLEDEDGEDDVDVVGDLFFQRSESESEEGKANVNDNDDDSDSE